MPTGTVTFLFTDIEESTRRWDADPSDTETLVASHDKLVRTVVDGHGGYVFATMGDGFGVAFARASDAVAAAVELQESFTGEGWASSGLLVRMGLHCGEAVERDGDYFGPTVNRTARIMALAHGGQILLSAVMAGLTQDFDTIELGEYQLRGMVRPERLYQVVSPGLARVFPPPGGLNRPAHNLPAALTSFVGRAAQVNAVAVRVIEGRLITLVGAGGAGKTRLAIETARRLLEEFPAGVWLAELAVLRDPAQVASTVATAIGYHDPLAEAGGPGLVRDRLGAAVGDQRVLLVLDNCEHVVGAAAELVGGLLGACPRLVVLATSRQSLGVAGERLVEVGSLDLPAGDEVTAVAGSGAGSLFLERAQAVHPRFELEGPTAVAVAEICRRLDGLPLAIELAAAQVRLLTAAQIAGRLEETLGLPAGGPGGSGRHHTMRAAMAWSYDLLGQAEQMLFRRLAVFRTSFVLEAAAAVAPGEGGDILRLLGALVDKSLVAVVDGPAGQRRFRLLEPVRQFAAELLRASGERDEAAGRHVEHLLARLRTPGSMWDPVAYAELAAEVDNVRAAAEYAGQDQPEAAVDLLLAYLKWWLDLGLIDEFQDRMGAALSGADPAGMPLDVLSDALRQASYTATHLGRLGDAAAFADRLAELRDRHPENLAVRQDWAFSLAGLTRHRAGGDRTLTFRLFRESQDAAEARGVARHAAVGAGNILMTAVLWDCVADPEVALAIRDAIPRAQTGVEKNFAVLARLLDGLIGVMGGEHDAYPLCLAAYAEMDDHDAGWTEQWAELCAGVAGELVGDQAGAAEHTLRWVRFCRRSGVRTILTCGIRGAARLSAGAGYPAQSLRLWGGAEQIERYDGLRYMPLMERLDRPLRQQSVDALGPEASRLLAQGASWSVIEVAQAAEETLLALQADNNWSVTRGPTVGPRDPKTPGGSRMTWSKSQVWRESAGW